MAESISPFEAVKTIHTKERLPDEIIDGISKWMVNKIFSCDMQLCMLANVLNTEHVTERMLYDCYFYGTERQPKKYIPYNAKKTAVEKEMRYIMDFYQVNQNVAKQYQQLISDEEKAKIVDYYEKRGIKKK